MKNFLFIIPTVIIIDVSIVGGMLMSTGAMKPSTMVIIVIIAFAIMMLIRPKGNTGGVTTDTSILLDEFAADAFADDASLRSKYFAAVKDYSGKQPLAASRKLERLQNECKNDVDKYAVYTLYGMVKASVGDFENAIKHYNKAIVLHPTAELAITIGSAHQRIGELAEARDSYNFALDLEPDNLDARSRLATAYVGDGMFDDATTEAQMVLDADENYASALSTCAICYGVMGNELLQKYYTEKAVENGYSEEKIKATIPALKKKFNL